MAFAGNHYPLVSVRRAAFCPNSFTIKSEWRDNEQARRWPMPHGCAGCLTILIILLVILIIVGVALVLIHPEIGIKLKEIWSILGQIWAIIR